MKIKVAKYISDFFVRNGITECFMVTGGGAMHLDDAIGHQEGMHTTFNHHEQACAIAAESYARYTRNLALVCVTSGPGGTNAITGVMGGWLDSIPMFIISGQVKRETTILACEELNLRQLGDQEFNIIDSVKNMTKYSRVITNPIEISYHLEKALYLSKNGRPGPVWLDIPLDVQSAMIETEDLIHFNCQDEFVWKIPEIKKDVIDIIVDKILNSKSPLILAGTGITSSGANEKLLKFIEKYHIPVVTAWNANDTVAFDNPLYVGMPGTVGIRSGNFAVQNCDLLINLGCRMNIRMIGYNHFDFAKNAFKISVDIDPRELFKPTTQIDLPINADVNNFLDRLLEIDYCVKEEHIRWATWCRNLLTRYPAVKPQMKDGELLNPYVFIDELFSNLNEKDKIICGNGSACVVTFQAAKIKQGQRMFTNSGCAAMGYGLPAALGVATSSNSNRTICIDGDGSVMMNIQELATIAYNNLNIKLFILNNDGYLSIKQTQNNLFQPPLIGLNKESGIQFPDFGVLSKAFDIPYYKVEKSNINEELRKVLESYGPCLCEVIVDPNQSFEPKSSSKIMPDGKIVSSSLDDMYPFLERFEYEENKYK